MAWTFVSYAGSSGPTKSSSRAQRACTRGFRCYSWRQRCSHRHGPVTTVGLAHHRVLDVDEVAASADVDQAAVSPAPAAPRPVYHWEAANQPKKDAVQQLAPLADAFDDLEARIDELIARTRILNSTDSRAGRYFYTRLVRNRRPCRRG